jgi:hypothetical protein
MDAPLDKEDFSLPSLSRISAKSLGALALPGFCPRCFWLQMHLEGRLPFQIFPGIFNTIDSYGKKLVHGWFDRHERPPEWLRPLGQIRGYRQPPHHSKFFAKDDDSGMMLWGSPDAIFEMSDGSFTIGDYKTAKFTAKQDELFPMYEVQLNAYAYIGERCGLKPVSKLALIYTEPVTDDASIESDANLNQDGFLMGFGVNILDVSIDPVLVPRLLRQARSILDLESVPAGREGCTDCQALARLIALTEK